MTISAHFTLNLVQKRVPAIHVLHPRTCSRAQLGSEPPPRRQSFTPRGLQLRHVRMSSPLASAHILPLQEAYSYRLQ
jgi:hypothetical protein